MGEQTQNLLADTANAAGDPEKTLVAPRFDAREVVTAQPVVPLADSPPARRASRPQQRQGTLPLVLILVSALVGGLVSVFAYRLYQQRAGHSSAREQQQQQQANVEAPPVTPDISAAVAETPAATPEASEETQPTPATEVAEVREEAVAPEAADEREEAREDRAGRALEPAARESAGREERPATTTAKRPSARRVEEIKTPTEDLRVRRGRGDGREASDYEVPARPRAERRATRRAERRAARRDDRERNIDRVRAIFEGPPPTR